MLKVDIEITQPSCCEEITLCDTTCEIDLCSDDVCVDGYGIDGNASKRDISYTRLNVVMPDGTAYNNVDINWKPGLPSHAVTQLTGGTAGVVVLNIDGIMIGDAIFITDIATTIQLLINSVNGNSTNSGWYAQLYQGATDTIEIISLNLGTLYNGADLNVDISGDLTLDMIIDPTADGDDNGDCVCISLPDIYGTNTPTNENVGPAYPDGVYRFTYIIYDSSDVELSRITKYFLFDCNVQNCIKQLILTMADGCCGCDSDFDEKVFKARSKVEQAFSQFEQGLYDCANDTMKSAGRICERICLDC